MRLSRLCVSASFVFRCFPHKTPQDSQQVDSRQVCPTLQPGEARRVVMGLHFTAVADGGGGRQCEGGGSLRAFFSLPPKITRVGLTSLH